MVEGQTEANYFQAKADGWIYGSVDGGECAHQVNPCGLVAIHALRLVPLRDTAAAHWRGKVRQTGGPPGQGLKHDDLR
jgi:hypothetical protein